jgi:transcriptional regulator with XRE-family HTH domain
MIMSKKQRDNHQRTDTLATLLMPIYEVKLEESLGNRLRELRRQQGLSLRALAEKSGLSANTLSLIENGKTSPSVATLQQIALALSIPITAFFEVQVNRDPIIYTRKDSRASASFIHGKLEELGTGVGNEGLQPFVISFDPGVDSGANPLTHEGTEFIFCLSGRVIYTVMGEEFVLEPGDSLLFSSKMPHTWRNPLDEPSKVIIVIATTEDRQRPIQISYPV